MDINNILKSSYLDILFDGKNKKYGGYELRKKYPKRAAIAGVISILLVGGLFAATLIKPKPKDDGILADVPVVTEMKNLEPPPPLKENEPPPPPPPTAPPPVKPTVKFTVPEIKKDAEVPKEEKLVEPPKKEDKAVVGVTTKEGSDDPEALDPGLSTLPSGNGKPEPVSVGGGEGNGPSKTEIFRSVEEMPKPPYDFNKYLSSHVKYPNAARENDIQGRVYVNFVVERDGSISNVAVAKGKELGAGIPEEAVRVVKSAPKWTPGKQNGQAVRVYYTVPVNFRLQ